MVRLCLVISFGICVCLGGCVGDDGATTGRHVDSNVPDGYVRQLLKHVATVNGYKIAERELLDVLLPSYGRDVLDDLILLEIVKQQAQEQGILVGKDVHRLREAELQRVLDDMAPDKPLHEQLSLLRYMLASRRMARAHFDIVLDKQALLRMMIDHNIEITDEMIKIEYKRQHGKRMQVRVLAMTNMREIEQVKRALAAGGDFVEMVETRSEEQVSLGNGGLVTVSEIDDGVVVAEIREAAFELTKVGQLSDIISYRIDNDQWWAIIRAERITLSDGVALAEVNEQIVNTLTRRETSRRMHELQTELESQATIHVVDSRLKKR